MLRHARVLILTLIAVALLSAGLIGCTNPTSLVGCPKPYAETVCIYENAYSGPIHVFSGSDQYYANDTYSNGDNVNDTASGVMNNTNKYLILFWDASYQGDAAICLAPNEGAQNFAGSDFGGFWGSIDNAASSHNLYTYDAFHKLQFPCDYYIDSNGTRHDNYQP